MSSGNFVAGKNGRLTVNGDPLHVESWDANHEVGEEETTGTESGGFYEGIPTIEKLEGSLDATWDSLKTPYSTTPGLVPGAFVDNLVLIATTGQTFNMPKAYIGSVNTSLDARGKVTFNCSFRSDGAFTVTV